MDDNVVMSSEDWKKFCFVSVIDPDGWDRQNFTFSWYEELVTRKEFEKRLYKSTCSGYDFSKKSIWKDK